MSARTSELVVDADDKVSTEGGTLKQNVGEAITRLPVIIDPLHSGASSRD